MGYPCCHFGYSYGPLVLSLWGFVGSPDRTDVVTIEEYVSCHRQRFNSDFYQFLTQQFNPPDYLYWIELIPQMFDQESLLRLIVWCGSASSKDRYLQLY